MDWDTFFRQRLADLGLEGAVSLLKHVSQNILYGIVNLRSELKGKLEQKRAETLIYDVNDLVNLWRHVYGRTWAWDAWRGDSIIHEGVRLELRSVTLHEYPSTKPGYRYCLPSEEYRRQARTYFPHSYQHIDEELDALYWGQQHQDIGILDVRYRSILVGTKRRYLLGATAGEAEGSPSSFPVVVGERVYQQLAEALRTYGAARVEKITGKISIGDERFKLPFRREFYRDPLFLEADESRKIVLMDKPHQVLGDAWTVAELDGTARILAFTFALGTIDWEERLKERCWRVEKICREHGGYPLVDFDAQRRRFTTARLYPEAIEGWYDQIIERLIPRSDPFNQTITRAITRNESASEVQSVVSAPMETIGIGKVIENKGNSLSPTQLSDLRQKLVAYFTADELRTVCFDIGIDYETLSGEGKEGKARELVAYLERRRRLPELIEVCSKLRPNISWV